MTVEAAMVTMTTNDDARGLSRSRSILMNSREYKTGRNSMKLIKDYDKKINNMKAATVNFRFTNRIIDDTSEEMMRRSFRKASSRNVMKNLQQEFVNSTKSFRSRRESMELRKTLSIIETTEKTMDDNSDFDSLDDISDIDLDKMNVETKKRLSFSEVTIKEYLYTIGDNPGGSLGVPLSMEWDPVHTEMIEFEEYESLRSNDRRMFHELKIPKETRVQRLLAIGFDMKEIVKAIKMVKRLQVQRLETKQFLYKAAAEERKERMKKKVKSFLTNYKKKERKYLERSMSFNPHQPDNLRSSMQIVQ